jgi:hypothetical protein
VASVSSCEGGIELSVAAATTVSDEWIVTPYAGSTLSGSTFSTGVHRTTNIVCGTLSFSVQPSDAEKDTTISPPVEVTTEPAAPGVDVTISIDSGPGDFGSGSTTTRTTDGSGLATFDDLTIDTAGAYTLLASADGYDSVPSDPFTIYESSLDCSSEGAQSFPNTDTTVQLTGSCSSVPATVTDDTVSFGKPQQADTQFEITIAWGLPAGPYPDYGHTTVTVNGLTFTPNLCTLAGGVPQHPGNPDGDGNFWPNGTAEQPWCVSASSVEPHHFGSPEDGFDGYQLIETFLGSGDPSFTTCRTCK